MSNKTFNFVYESSNGSLSSVLNLDGKDLNTNQISTAILETEFEDVENNTLSLHQHVDLLNQSHMLAKKLHSLTSDCSSTDDIIITYSNPCPDNSTATVTYTIHTDVVNY